MNMPEMGKTQIRRATKADYETVLKIIIPDYDTDYLPAYYDSFIDDPNKICYLAEKDGKVVSFTVGLVSNGGQTYTQIAGRTIDDMRNTGIMMQLSRTLLVEMMEKYSSLKEMIWDSISEEATKKYLASENKLPSTRLVHTRDWLKASKTSPQLLDSILTQEFLDKANEVYPLDHIKVHNPSAAYDLFTDASHLLPDNKRIQVHFVPYTINRHDFPSCVTSAFICSSRKNGHPDALHDGISIGTCLPTPGGTTYIVEFYGRDADCAYGHFVRHMIHLLLKRVNSNLILEIGVVRPFDITGLSDLLNITGLRFHKQRSAFCVVGEFRKSNL